VLAYPNGARSVRCPLCQAETNVSVVHIRCVNCGIALALPPTAQLAQCPTCRTIMAMPRNIQVQPNRPAGGPPGPPPPPPKTIVYIENPPKKGDAGSTNMTIGTKLDDNF
jgi:LSD1 subclass zinc finger protein